MATLKNNTVKVDFDNNVYSLSLPGFKLENCAPALWLNGDKIAMGWKTECADHEKMILSGSNSLGEWHLEFRFVQNLDGLNGVSVRLSGKLAKPCRELRIAPLTLPELQLDHLLSQGVAMGRCRSVKFPASDINETGMNGSYILMLSRGGMHLQISHPLRQKITTNFTAQIMQNGIEELIASASTLHNDNLEIDTDPIEIYSSAEPFAMMTAWAETNTEVRKDFTNLVKPGWNSWDYYRWTITEDEVLKNAEFIAADPVLSKHVKRIIVDDGWQYCYGEWDANPLFPNGMEYLAKELTKLGFEPGLWFAPTIVEPHCRIAQLDYDMLAMSEGGHPCLCYSCMERFGFVLDPTVPKVQKHLYDLFDRYASMGYKYFKLDFLGQTLKARQFHDRTVPRSEIIRMIVKPIAEAVEGRATILGCNYNFEAGNRYVDAARIGSDIHSTWNGICHNVISVAARFWSNKRWWVNDPDFALARALDTSNDPDIVRLKPCLVYAKADSPHKDLFDFVMVDIKEPQSELLLSIVLMAAGAVNLSDNMPRLNEKGLNLARRVVAAESGEPAIPLDLFESEKPARWLQKISDGYRVLLINWEDQPCEMCFDLKANGVEATSAVDFWYDTPVEITNGVIRKTLPPRSCLLTVIKV